MSILSSLNPASWTATIYKWLAGLAIVLAIAIGSFFYGKHYGDEQAKVAISGFDTRVIELQNKLDQTLLPQQIQVVTKYQTQTIHDAQVGVDNGKTIQTQVKDDVGKYLPLGWVSTHDAAATNTAVDSAAAANGAASTFTPIDALFSVSNNYATCNQYRETIIGLQATINNYNNAIVKVNATAIKSKQ